MSKRLVAILLTIALVSFVAFLALRYMAPPSGIETKGESQASIAQYLSLGTSVVSLLTALVGLVKTAKK